MYSDAYLQASSFHANTGYGPQLAVLDIGLGDQVAVVEPNTGFWALAEASAVHEAISGKLLEDYQEHAESFQKEMELFRFGLKPSAAYFNPTEQCNFNCTYCYLPEDMRKNGKTMTYDEICDALDRLSGYFATTMDKDENPQIIFHGSEPMIAREPMFAAIEKYQHRFHFGIQTNATLLDDSAISFLMDHGVGIGISLDAPTADIADSTRKNWHGNGAFDQVVRVMDKLASYPAFNVITTVTSANTESLVQMVDFYHAHGVRQVMFNPVRCTQPGGQRLKPDNKVLADAFCRALDRTYELYEKTGKKTVVVNFANILAAIAGPTSRRLMCDISPCGGGRCFFAVSAAGDIFPCSEFIGFSEFKGGNLYTDNIDSILETEPFKAVTTRKIEAITPCAACAIRHFCGAPCPAEVKMVSGTLNAPSPYCEFYEAQVRYAFRVIARAWENAYMWDGWEEETEETFRWAS